MDRVLNEIDLHHMTAEEADFSLDQYLHDAFMAGKMRVKIIHGKGSGTLRQVVSKKLAAHPLVRSYRLAGYGEGGDGVTIAELVWK
jgi:DNA mismatch repair protein MutS2